MIIGFTGRKGSGKDTAAAVLQPAYTNLKMAGALKAMLSALLSYQGVGQGIIDRMIEGDLKEVPTEYLGGKTPRYAMQTLGTEWGRDLISKTLWLDTFKQAAKLYPDVVCSDVRFLNECDAVDFVVRISRPGTANENDHPSETEIDNLPVTLEIVNDFATKKEFQAEVAKRLPLTSPRSSVR